MATITESITADVPIDYADREWTEYMFSALYRGNADPAHDLNRESEKLDASSCVVRFVDESDDRVNVSVTVECEVPTDDERVREQLRRDLQQYHEFLVAHCAKDHCRPS